MKERLPSPEGTPAERQWPIVGGMITGARRALTWVFKTRIPAELQQRGLTEEMYAEIDRRFYAMMRGQEDVGQKRILKKVAGGQRTILQGFGDALLHQGWHERDRRSEEILRCLVEEYGFEHDAQIREFLEQKFLRQPPALG